MPLVESKYKNRPWYFFNRHFETIIPSITNASVKVHYQRERLELDDGDFLDLDWIKNGHSRLIILSHGLEGSSSRHYIRRPARFFSEKGWDILAWNNRSCSGEMNRLPRFYHHGATEDLGAVIDHALRQKYQQIVLIGFSMGAGMQQKYLGERRVASEIAGAISFSAPCDLHGSLQALKEGFSAYYERRFVRKIKEKILRKAEVLDMDVGGLEAVKSFAELDTAHTLRVFKGFKNATDFYTKISSYQFLKRIQVPLLIVNAANDPMLSGLCYPSDIAEQQDNVFLEVPSKGGHVGFYLPNDRYSYMEYAAEEFIETTILPSL
ncbi:MAG: alpha/beta fold hydrolase [Bacteroidota bacterium]